MRPQQHCTGLLKYGDIQEKIYNISIETYGFRKPHKNSDIREKICNTNNETYEFTGPLKNEEFEQQMIDNCLKTHGVQ